MWIGSATYHKITLAVMQGIQVGTLLTYLLSVLILGRTIVRAYNRWLPYADIKMMMGLELILVGGLIRSSYQTWIYISYGAVGISLPPEVQILVQGLVVTGGACIVEKWTVLQRYLKGRNTYLVWASFVGIVVVATACVMGL